MFIVSTSFDTKSRCTDVMPIVIPVVESAETDCQLKQLLQEGNIEIFIGEWSAEPARWMHLKR
jgi:hypothetical protein